MNSVARHLSDSVSIRWGTCVGRIRKEGRAIVLFDEKDAPLGGYDALIVSTPPEQGIQLLSRATALAGRVAGVRMDPCWSVMLAFRDPLDLDADGLFIQGSALLWACRNSSKPGRGIAETWVLHAVSEWSAAHLESDPDEVAGRLTKAFFDAAGRTAVEPLLASAHCWRHARAANPLEEECLWDPEEKIGVCGDWCCRSRIEGAFLSGAALAGRILGAAGTWPESFRKVASFP
jgi:predicted NAD/FAD-dependent oxidoreductase